MTKFDITSQNKTTLPWSVFPNNVKNDKTNVNIYSLTDLIPVILSELSIKDLLNVSQTNKYFLVLSPSQHTLSSSCFFVIN